MNSENTKLLANLSIRKLELKDLEEVLEIENLSFSSPWSRESYQRELTENGLAHYLGCFVADKNNRDKLAAYAGFWLILDEGHIANVAVHPLYRHQGLGELLMRHLMTYCQMKGGCWMTLEVRVSNEIAHNLYAKLGFHDLGKRKGYYDNGEDAMIMWCSLKRHEGQD